MNYIKLNEENLRKIREIEAEHRERYNRAFKNRIERIAKAKEAISKDIDKVRELREKANNIEASIETYIKSETIKANQELHEAIIKNKQRYFEEVDKVCREAWKEKIKVHNKSIEGLKQDKPSEEEHSKVGKDLTEADMLDYIRNADLHSAARLYCDLSDLRPVLIRKERQCELCNKEVSPYNQMILTNKYYNKKTGDGFDYYWDSGLEIINDSGDVNVVDLDYKTFKLDKKQIYMDVECAYNKVKEAEEITKELRNRLKNGFNLGYKDI